MSRSTSLANRSDASRASTSSRWRCWIFIRNDASPAAEGCTAAQTRCAVAKSSTAARSPAKSSAACTFAAATSDDGGLGPRAVAPSALIPNPSTTNDLANRSAEANAVVRSAESTAASIAADSRTNRSVGKSPDLSACAINAAASLRRPSIERSASSVANTSRIVVLTGANSALVGTGLRVSAGAVGTGVAGVAVESVGFIDVAVVFKGPEPVVAVGVGVFELVGRGEDSVALGGVQSSSKMLCG